MIDELLKGHQFYALSLPYGNKRVRGLKYMGQNPIYRTIQQPSITLYRIPSIITQDLIDKLSKLKYNGLYDAGPTKVPHFIEE